MISALRLTSLLVLKGILEDSLRLLQPSLVKEAQTVVVYVGRWRKYAVFQATAKLGRVYSQAFSRLRTSHILVSLRYSRARHLAQMLRHCEVLVKTTRLCKSMLVCVGESIHALHFLVLHVMC